MNKLFKEFLTNPKQTGSIIPSSRYLVKKMTEHICCGDRVVELGAGTGCITEQIEKMQCEDIIVYENNVSFHQNLQRLRNLGVENIKHNAFDIDSDLAENSVDNIICALPLVNFSYQDRFLLLTKAHKVLKYNCIFTMFTYKAQFPLSLHDLQSIGFSIVKKHTVWLNVPPATVLSLQKRAAQ